MFANTYLQMQLPDKWKIGLCVVTAAVLRDAVIWRSLKYGILPSAVAAVAYRLRHLDEPSVLEYLLGCLPGKTKLADSLLEDAIGLLLLGTLVRLCRSIWSARLVDVKGAVSDSIFWYIKRAPYVQRKLERKMHELEKDLEASLKGKVIAEQFQSLPAKGRPAAHILQQLRTCEKEEKVKYEEGYVSGAVYSGERDLLELVGQVASLYSLTNPLHPDLFPSLMKMEAEICSMVANLVCGGVKGVCGALTSGGTESIILAAKAHRDFFREERGVIRPQIVACVSAHAAIRKAADLLRMKLRLVPMDQDYRVNVRVMQRSITADTVLLYASAPTFAQGVIDPISDISRLGMRYNIGVHVDCCLGGFILPFAEKLGYKIPPFDFRLPGVTSMSIDTHKYGYTSKGTSVVVYRSKELRRYQYFCFPDWPGGLYVTPTIAGSRPGALSAACWAALVNVGEDGYLERTRQILETAQRIAEGVRKIPGLALQGKVEAMIVCLSGVDGVNIYEVGDLMSKKGWALNTLQSPPGLHLCCTLRHVDKHDKFLTDLGAAAAEVLIQVKEGHPSAPHGNAAIYGMTGSLPAGPINEMLRVYTDVVLKA